MNHHELSPIQAANDLTAQHNESLRMVSGMPEIMKAAGIIAANGVVTESGLLLPSGASSDQRPQPEPEMLAPRPEELDPKTAMNNEQTWKAMSPERQTRASAIKATMAERFGVPEESFGLFVDVNSDGLRQFTLAYTGADTKAWGAWHSIMHEGSNEARVQAGQDIIDTRKGMTFSIYNAMVERAREAGDPLPDSEQLSQVMGTNHTATFMTGELHKGEVLKEAPLSTVEGGDIQSAKVMNYVMPSGDGSKSQVVRFRPAAIIP